MTSAIAEKTTPKILLRIAPRLTVIALQRHHVNALAKSLGVASFGEYALRMLTMPGHAYSVLRDGRLIGAGGVMPLWPGVGEAVMFITDELRNDFPIALHKATLWGLKKIQQEFGYHRIQTFVRHDFAAGSKWASRLGFQFEGAMPLYTTDRRTMMRFGQTWS